MSNSKFRPANVLLAAILVSLAACSPPSRQASDASDASSPSDKSAPPSSQGSSMSGEAPSIERSVAALFNGAKPKSVTESVIPGLYEVAVRGGVFYTDKEGKYFLNGEMIEVEGRKSMSALTRDKMRGEMMGQLQVKDAIVFKAKGNPKEVLNVFTDVECGYCREFHKHIEAYNSQGYEVRYYPWPRSGPQGPVFDEMVAVWCSKDQRKALGLAKSGKRVSGKSCDNPVAKYYEMGQELGVTGTPAVFLADGKQVGGYVPPESMEATISRVKNPPAAQ